MFIECFNVCVKGIWYSLDSKTVGYNPSEHTWVLGVGTRNQKDFNATDVWEDLLFIKSYMMDYSCYSTSRPKHLFRPNVVGLIYPKRYKYFINFWCNFSTPPLLSSYIKFKHLYI